MRLCKTTELRGGEILARTVMTQEFQVLLSEGITLRPEYIEKIRELGINEVYIKEKGLKEEEIHLLKSDIENVFHSKVKSIMEKHTYHKNKELMELSKTADGIITSILEEDEIVERIYDVKERSPDIYEHSIAICSLATLTALKLKLNRKIVHDIGVGCLLHDLGLRYLTVEYANKSMDQMSAAEHSEYMKHPVYGYTSLKDETWISELSKNIILQHHERLDGTGFPLKARDISLEVRIVAVCDAFDEIICGIGCERQKVYKAVEFLKTFKGIKFDSKVVDTFLEFTAVYPVGSEVLLSDGSIGRVIRQNREFPDRPVLQMLKDNKGNLAKQETVVDLVRINHIFVEKVLE